MPGYAFQTQLFFLFQRQKQVQAIAQPNVFGAAVVSDFMLAKDALFARLTLSDEEHRLYAQMYAQVAAQVREPDLVVWLQASPDTLLARVRRRGIAMEHAIDEAYLGRLCDAYAEHFHSYEGAPVFCAGRHRARELRRARVRGRPPDRPSRPLRRAARHPGHEHDPAMTTGRPTILSFDLDGTLVDTAAEIAEAANLALQDLGFAPRSLPTIEKLIGAGTRELMLRLLRSASDARAPVDGDAALARSPSTTPPSPDRRARPTKAASMRSSACARAACAWRA